VDTDLDTFLLNLRDYFDQRADADGDVHSFVPNEEMLILAELDHFIAAREKAVR
jgi:hypothetical protein